MRSHRTIIHTYLATLHTLGRPLFRSNFAH
jgi:hypothetical protein